MTSLPRVVASLICASILMVPAFASAADDTLLVGGASGFGGEFDGHIDTDLPLNLLDTDINNQDMEPSWGAMVHYDTGVHKYLALGARFNFGSFIDEGRADDDWSRNWLINADIAPRLRFGVPNQPIEAYLTTPVGISFLFPGEDWKDESNVDFDTGISWNLSILAGVDFQLNNDFGLFIEGGWMLQNLAWEGKSTNADINVQLDGSYSQFALNVGVLLPM